MSDIPDARRIDENFIVPDAIARHPAMPLLKPDPQFHPRQVRAQASVGASSEGDVTVATPVEAHLFRCLLYTSDAADE